MFGLAWRHWARDQQDLVERLKETGVLRSPSVEFAFRLVDRAEFVPSVRLTPTPASSSDPSEAAGEDESRSSATVGARLTGPTTLLRPTPTQDHQAYIDGPIKIDHCHISAPHVYAVVLEKLQIQPGMSFLNIGSGSGYLSCMCSVLVGRGGRSDGIERLSEVVTHARKCSKRWLAKMNRMRKEQRAAWEEEANKLKQKLQPTDVEMTPPAAAAGHLSPIASPMSIDESEEHKTDWDDKATRSRQASSGRASPSHHSEDEEETQPRAASSSSSSSTSVPASAAPHPLPRAFAAIELERVDRPTRRGILGPAADVIPKRSREGEQDVSDALQQSALPIQTVIDRLMVPRSSPSPMPMSDSPESVDESITLPSWRPTQPIPKVSEPQFICGDAFDLDPGVCGLYDRIYVGAATPEEYIPFFASFLHPNGRLVGPFGPAMTLITKRRDGSLQKDRISDVSYAPLVLPPKDAPPAPKPVIRFPQPVFNAPYGFSRLPRDMKSVIDALLMLQRRDDGNGFGRLPMVLLMHIMSFLPIDDFMDRAVNNVPWAVDCKQLLAEARAKYQLANTHSSNSVNANDSEFKLADRALNESFTLVEQARDWIEMKIPTAMPEFEDNEEEDEEKSSERTEEGSTPKASSSSSSSSSFDVPLPLVTIGGVSTDLACLREIRTHPSNVVTGSSSSDPIPEQVLFIYWSILSSQLSLYSDHHPSSAIRSARRILALRPSDARIWSLLAKNYFKDHQLVEALAASQRALRVSKEVGATSEEIKTITTLIDDINNSLPTLRRQQHRIAERLLGLLFAPMFEPDADEEEEEEEVEHQMEEDEP